MSTVDTGQARAVDDPPKLAVDRVQMQTWAQEITMIVEALQRWRLHRDRVAEDAARRHDEQERSARAPLARPLTEPEAAAWRDGAADEAHTETRFDVRTGRGLRVRFGPVEPGRWVLDAQVDQAPAPTTGESGSAAEPVTVDQVAVSCRTEQDARAFAQALLGAGPDVQTLRALRRRAAQRAARQAAAASRVRETDPQLLERVRDEVRRHWRPELAERVIASPAFGRFARRLGELESHGATIDDVLRRQGLQDKLARPLVRDPAAFGASLFASLLTTIDGEVVPDAGSSRTPPGEQARRRPSPTPRGAGQAQAADAPSDGRTPQERAWLRSITEDSVWPALSAALGEPVARQVRAAGGYERLARELAARHAVGWSLEALLAGLPAGRIITAGDPAGYLGGIIARRVAQRGPEQRTARRPAERERIDQHALARVVGEVFPDATARRLTECPAWPALCTQMTRAQPRTADDPPLAALLGQLPARAIERARKPAAYAAELLRRELAIRRSADPAAEMAAEDARLGRGPAAGAGLGSSSALDRIALDDLTAPAPPTQARSTPGERLSPLVQAQLLLTASRALRRGSLTQDVVALRGQPGAADPALAHKEVAARGLVYTSGGRTRLRDGKWVDDLADLMDLPRAQLYAAVVVVADQNDPRLAAPGAITRSLLHQRLGPINYDKAVALMHTLADHGIISPGGDNDARQALITPDQVPDVLRTLDVAADPAAEVEAAAHRHTAAQQLGLAGGLQRDADRERGAPDPTEETTPTPDEPAGADLEVGIGDNIAPAADLTGDPEVRVGVDAGADGLRADSAGEPAGAEAEAEAGRARVDDNLAAAARANAAREMGSGAAAALRAQVVNTPHDASRPSNPAQTAGAAAVKSAPKVTLQRGRRR